MRTAARAAVQRCAAACCQLHQSCTATPEPAVTLLSSSLNSTQCAADHTPCCSLQCLTAAPAVLHPELPSCQVLSCPALPSALHCTALHVWLLSMACPSGHVQLQPSTRSQGAGPALAAAHAGGPLVGRGSGAPVSAPVGACGRPPRVPWWVGGSPPVIHALSPGGPAPAAPLPVHIGAVRVGPAVRVPRVAAPLLVAVAGVPLVAVVAATLLCVALPFIPACPGCQQVSAWAWASDAWSCQQRRVDISRCRSPASSSCCSSLAGNRASRRLLTPGADAGQANSWTLTR